MHPHRDMEIITYVLEGALAHKDSMGSFSEEEKRGRLRLIASPDGAEGSVTIHQDARLYASLISPGQQVEHELNKGRFGWLQVAKARPI